MDDAKTTTFSADTSRTLEMNRPAAGLPSVYANNITLNATQLDIRLVFGEVMDITNEKIVVEQRVQVTVGWAEASTLHRFLTAYLEMYERNNGPLKQPIITSVEVEGATPVHPKPAS